MQLKSLLALSALAAPIFGSPLSLTKRDSWTIASFTRTCDSADTTCAFSFSINKNDGSAPTTCQYSASGAPASHATYSNVACGSFVIGSSWSNQFGFGFSTLSVVENGLILINGVAVQPDMNYTPGPVP
ncbi:uncharacterized protein KY384_001731 [Bacidia gigantensis]|uniref:uncharacterized protein n=1 Tax=Bacidia gigantensis TaxID=2732470 RepID=UPI001D0590BE|nr:uncharacterized protein KY384_001731 [Bacidia gigantensis]KAG8533988.1 hypothetical protein KY384_001731 [Bacidia gigantensis]